MTAHEWTHHDTIVNGVRLHYVTAGDGPLVVLLHGFPECWWSWHHQITALADAGFKVVAPDMRGYNTSEKPAGVHAYDIDTLAADVAELLQQFGGEEGGFLVGHDWGGVVAWHTAARHSALVRKLAILNAPHPQRFMDILRTVPSQRRKSWYVGFFQLPFLPELVLPRTAAQVRRFFVGSGGDPARFSTEDAQHYADALRQPGARTAMLNYYRSMGRQVLRSGGRRSSSSLVPMPTLLLWGERDVALDIANADATALRRWVPDLEVERLDASHWVQNDVPERVNDALIRFFG